MVGARANHRFMFVTPEILEDELADAQRRLRHWVGHYRENLGFSKNHLSRMSGVSKQGLLYMMGEEREPRLRSLVAIAKALDVSVADLFQPIPAGVEPRTDW